MFAPKNILIPTDFSNYAREALEEGLSLARQYHSKVYLLHVAEPVEQCSAESCLEPEATRELEEDELRTAKDLMKKELRQFSDIRDMDVESDVRQGDTVDEILREQQEKDIDLIVMPSHRRGMGDRMSPIAHRIMSRAKIPVLFVRHKDTQA